MIMDNPDVQHTCHAFSCKQIVPPAIFMCKKHWTMLPARFQKAVYRTYRRNQEIDKKPSAEYLEAARRAIAYIAKEERVIVPEAYRRYLQGELKQ